MDSPGWERVEERVRNELRNHFRPEFLNRVDDIIVFRQLSREDLVQIVDLQLEKLIQTLAERRINLEVTPEAKAFIAAEGYDPVYGARPLKRVIQRLLQNPIALELLEGNFGEGDTVRVERDGEVLRFKKTQTERAGGARDGRCVGVPLRPVISLECRPPSGSPGPGRFGRRFQWAPW